MRYIGLDLAQTTSHKAVVIDEGGQVITPVLSVKTSAISLVLLFEHAREGAPAEEPLIVVMEPTGMAWFPIAVFCQRQGVKVYLVNSQQVADLRRFYRKHAKSDRIDARVLARLPIVNPEKLHALQLIGARQMACQRGCKELDRLTDLMVAIQNRLRASIALPGRVWRKFCPRTLRLSRAGFARTGTIQAQFWQPVRQVCWPTGRKTGQNRLKCPNRTSGRAHLSSLRKKFWPYMDRRQPSWTTIICGRKSAASRPCWPRWKMNISSCSWGLSVHSIVNCTQAEILKPYMV